MRWQAQVVHVARKDLRLAGWLILAYAAVVAGATASATEWAVVPGTAAPYWMFGLVLLGMILFAMLVQADSPARTDAFWATRPLYPSAVVSAKILAALLLLLGLPLLGQLIGLIAHDVAAPDLPVLLGESALSYGRWLGIAAVIAALTRDLRTFVIALVVVTIGWGVGTGVIAARTGPREASGSSLILIAAGVVGMLLVLAHQYLTRNVRRGVIITGVLAVASLLLPLVLPRSLPASEEVPHRLRLTEIRIEEIRFQKMTGGGTQAWLRLRTEGASALHRYTLVLLGIRLHMPDGSIEEIPINRPFVEFNAPPLPATEEFQWLGAHDLPRDSLFTVPVDLSEPQKEALSGGGARLALRGGIEVQELRVMALLPLHAGAAAAHHGHRVRVIGVDSTADAPSVEVRMSSVSSSSSPDPRRVDSFGRRNPFSYALLNTERQEALTLNPRQTSGSDLALVLPGPRTSTETTQLQRVPGYATASLARVNQEWLRRARLLLVRWAPLGSYPVRIEMDGRRPARVRSDSGRPVGSGDAK